MSIQNDIDYRNCGNCHFAVTGEINPGMLKTQKFCHRVPPVLSHISTQQGIVSIVAFPSVQMNMICGEYLFNEPQKSS